MELQSVSYHLHSNQTLTEFGETASATVAGLAAYIRGLGLSRFTQPQQGGSWNDVVNDLKSQIEDWAWDRIILQQRTPIRSLWNGQPVPACAAAGGNQNGKRQACSRTSTISSSSSSTSSSSTSSPPAQTTGTLTCQQPRPAGAPTGSQVANALTSDNQLATYCAAQFDGSGDSTHMSFNHGGETITVQRESDTEQLTFCMEGLNAIISGCIQNGGDYGGVYTRGDQKYTITNSEFPNNPLLPTDPGGNGLTTCQQPRPQGAPAGQQIANVLTANNGLQGICSAQFDGSGTSLQETFNNGFIDITVARGSSTEQLTFCMAGLNAIISSCIEDGGDYGGTYIQGDQTYTITNSIFPNNPITPGQPGGPPLSTPPITTPPTTTKQPPAQTVTSNCEVCVLPFGSNEPFCTAIPGCTPTSSTTSSPASPTPTCIIE